MEKMYLNQIKIFQFLFLENKITKIKAYFKKLLRGHRQIVSKPKQNQQCGDYQNQTRIFIIFGSSNIISFQRSIKKMNQIFMTSYTKPCIISMNSNSNCIISNTSTINLFFILSQTLTASVSTFSKNLKEQKNRHQNSKTEIEYFEIGSDEELPPTLKNKCFDKNVEEKVEILTVNPSDLLTQCVKMKTSPELFSSPSNSQIIQFEQSPLAKPQRLVQISIFQIQCPKMNLNLQQIQSKKQRLLQQKVTDWSKVNKKKIDKQNQSRNREMKMLFR